jgi:hypothetical protein
MDIDSALAKLASAPLDYADLSQIEARVMGRLAQTTTIIRSQAPIRFGVMVAAVVVGMSLGGIAVASGRSGWTLVSGAHLAPSALLAFPS